MIISRPIHITANGIIPLFLMAEQYSFIYIYIYVVIQSLSHVQLCNLLDCRTPGFPVLHCLPEFARTHVHRLSDAIQPSHPRSSPSPCLQSFLASGSFPMSWLPFAVSPKDSQESCPAPRLKHFFGTQPSLWSCCQIHT